MPRYYEIDKDAIRELLLYAENTSDFYFKGVIPLLENYTKKYVKGDFVKEKAYKGFQNLIPYAIQLYYREFGDRMSFNTKEKEIIGKELYDHYEDLLGEMVKSAKKLKAKSAKKTTKKSTKKSTRK